MGFNYSVTLVKALERPHGRGYRCDRSTEVNTKQRSRAVTAPAGPGQTRSTESGAWYRAGARSLTSKLKRLINCMWPGEFFDRGISNNKSRLGWGNQTRESNPSACTLKFFRTLLWSFRSMQLFDARSLWAAQVHSFNLFRQNINFHGVKIDKN